MGWKRNLGIGFGVLFGLALVGAALGDPADDSPEEASAIDAEFVAMPGLDNYAMIFPEDTAPAALEDAARAKCHGKQICQVLGWTDKADAAPRLPMLDREMERLAFSYSLNRNTSYENFSFSCDRFPQPDPARCLAK